MGATSKGSPQKSAPELIGDAHRLPRLVEDGTHPARVFPIFRPSLGECILFSLFVKNRLSCPSV